MVIAISIFLLGLTYLMAYNKEFKDGVVYNSLKSGTATKIREDSNLMSTSTVINSVSEVAHSRLRE